MSNCYIVHYKPDCLSTVKNVSENMEDKGEDSDLTKEQNKKSYSDSPIPMNTTESANSDNEQNLGSVIKTGCSSPHDGRLLMQEVFPIRIDQLFTLLFTNSQFYFDFHTNRKTTNLVEGEWEQNAEEKSKRRIVTFTMALHQVIGPKTAQVTEIQTMLPCTKVGDLYSIDVETLNAGIPYASSFCVFVHYCLKKVSETHSSLTTYGQVKYKKSVLGFVKGMIERNCTAGLDDYFAHLSKALRRDNEESIPDGKRKLRRRRKRTNSRTIIEDSTIHITSRKKTQSGFLSCNITTIVLVMILLVSIVNVFLYYKLAALEQLNSYGDVPIIQNPFKTYDEGIKLLKEQETFHSIEAQKWKSILKTSLKLLQQTEESLKELQSSVQSTYTNNK